MNRSGIEWTDDTWNPIVGCRHGCCYCYARELATTRLAKMPNACPDCATFEPHIHPERIFQPLQRKKPTTIFVGSMSDMWGDWVPKDWIESVLQVIAACPQHTFLTLTKNPKRYQMFELPENLWCGATVTNHKDLHVSLVNLWPLRKTKQVFLSFEPLLDDVTGWLYDPPNDRIRLFGDDMDWLSAIIIGPLNGHGRDLVTKRSWVESIIEIAQEAKVPVFLKSECRKIGFTSTDLLARNLRELPWPVTRWENEVFIRR